MADVSQIRVPPHSENAEVSVLGALLLDKDAVIAVAEFLKPEDFYDDRHKEIFECAVELYEERVPVDVLTVSERLKKRKALKMIGGTGYLTDMVNKVPTAAHVEHYGKIVKDAAIKRLLLASATHLVDLSLDEGTNADELMDKAESDIFSLSQRHLSKSFTLVKDALAESFDRLDELHKQGEGLRGVPTGFKDLDDCLAGMQKSNLLILAARPGVGKCVAGDTLITDPDTGRRQTIQSIVLRKKGKVTVLDERLRLKNVKPSVFVDDGKKPVYKVTTTLGNRIEATAIHPLLTIDGWKKLEELKKGDRIAVPRKVDCFGKKEWEEWKLKSLAYFLGDGGLTKKSPMFTNSDTVVLDDFIKAVKKFGEVEVKYVKQSERRLRTPSIVVKKMNPYKKELRKGFSKMIKKYLLESGLSQNKLALDLKISPSLVNLWTKGKSLPGPQTLQKLENLFGKSVEKINRSNPVTIWLTELGLMGKLSTHKEIPPEIFELKKKDVSIFLNRLFTCEGSVMVSTGKGVGRISFASSSYKMAEQVKHLLLRFGILARLRTKHVKYKSEIKLAYEIEILNSEDILKFAQEIGIFSKEKKLKELIRLVQIKKTTKNWTKDTLPLGVWKLIIQEKGKLSWRQLYKKMGRPLSHNIHVYKRQLRRETLEEIARALKSRKLLDLATSDIYWDRIKNIRPSGIKQVYDLTVEKLHNFVANDIVVHNTSLALNIAQNLAVKYKRSVGFFSLEMSREELVDRLLVAQADIDAWKLKTGKLGEDDFTKLSNAMGELAEAPLFIDDTPALSILEMRTKARRLQVEHGIDLLIVDYLQLARSRQLENRVQEVSEISQGLKNLARELKVPVLCISQLNRAVETRGGQKRPQLSDLRESGCLTGDSLIVRADSGKRVTIKSLVGKKDVPTLALTNDGFKLKKVYISKVFSSGRKMVYMLTLKSGKIIEASGNHPFFKFAEWSRLDSLKVGDRIATPRSLPTGYNQKVIGDNKLIVLGHLIGDGCFVKRQPLHYTNSEMVLINIVKDAARKEFSIVPRIIKEKNCFNLYLSSKEKLTHGKRNPICKWLDEDLSIYYGLHSREKFIPEIIFQQKESKISLFLKHLWSTDGCVYLYGGKQKKKVTLYYASGSRKLAENVSHLLLRVGIISTITVSKKKGYGDIYNVQIQGKENQLKYLKKIGFVGEKSNKVKRAIKFLQTIKANPNTDVIPKDIWKYIEQVRKDKKITTREFHKKMGWAYSGTQRLGNGVSRERLGRIAKVLDNKYLLSLADSDIYWDEVKSIQKIGIMEVYDATVPEHANFVANDIIVHNSIEQDADVVMFLWREDEENLENMVLDIAKHRNGPLKSIQLFFKGDRIKFYGRETKRT